MSPRCLIIHSKKFYTPATLKNFHSRNRVILSKSTPYQDAPDKNCPNHDSRKYHEKTISWQSDNPGYRGTDKINKLKIKDVEV